MVDPLKIMARVKELGASLALDSSGLRIIGRDRLPPAAIEYIAAHRAVLMQHLGADEPEEAGPIDFGKGTPPEWLALFSDTLTRQRPANVLDSDWQWFLTRCRQIVDEASYLRGAH